MAVINRSHFYSNYRKEFGTLKHPQVKYINILLDSIENDPLADDVYHLCYIMATVKHETADTYKPLREYGRGAGRSYGQPVGPYNHVYYGRGYVQLTWMENYKFQGSKIGVDFVKYPDLVMDPEYAYIILANGMRMGDFTGRRLSNYINAKKKDYVQARRVVNGMDKAELIATYARSFEKCLI